MRLLFQHLAGRITHTDWQYTPVYAVFEKDEFEKAAETGWLPHEYEPPLWFQSRQVRYRLDALQHHKRHKIPKRIDFDVVNHLNHWDLYEEIWESYLRKKGFSLSFVLEDLFKLDKDLKQVVEVYDYDKMVAFSIMRMEPVQVSLQFAWTYHEPKLSLGNHCQYFELQHLSKLGYKYNHVCPGYESTCVWKSRFPGFEFWTGLNWSSDKKLYERLCLRDTSIQNINDLSDDDPLPIQDNINFNRIHNW